MLAALLYVAAQAPSVLVEPGELDLLWEARPLPVPSDGWSDMPDICVPGDLNGDGAPDFVTVEIHDAWGGWQPTQLHAVSGKTGAAIWSHPYLLKSHSPGRHIEAIDDLDGDGIVDLLIGSPLDRNQVSHWAGSVETRSGATGALIHRLEGDSYREFLGSAIAPFDDLNGDGLPEYLVGATQSGQWMGAYTGCGWVGAVDGATGRVLYRTWGEHGLDPSFGAALAVLADVDGDGVRDYLVGAPTFRNTWSRVGKVSLHSGADGRELDSWIGRPNSHFGNRLVALDDLDGDGIPEWATVDAVFGAAENGIQIRSIHRDQPLRLIHGPWLIDSTHQVELRMVPDIDGDGHREMLAATPKSPAAPGSGTGECRLLGSSAWADLCSFRGVEQAGNPFIISAGWRVGRGFTEPNSGRVQFLVLVQDGPDQRYFLVDGHAGVELSTAQVSLAATPTTVDVGVRLPSSEAHLSFRILLSTDAGGGAQFLGLPIPLGPSPLLTEVLLGQFPHLLGGAGTLDAGGDADAVLDLPTGLPAGLAGRSIHLCAVSHLGLNASLASRTVSLEFLP